MTYRLYSALVATLTLAASTAQAAPKERIAIASFVADGESLPQQRNAYLKDVIAGLTFGFDVVPDETVQQLLRANPGASCSATVCLANLARLLGVQYLVRASIAQTGGSNFQIHVDLTHAADGRIVAQTDDPCVACTTKEAHEALSNSAAQMRLGFERSERRPPQLAVSPPSQLVPKENGRLVERRSMRWAAIGSWIGGGALLVTGVALLAVDGTERGYSVDPSGHVRVERLSTMAAGATLTAVGAAAVITGGFLWWRDKRNHQVHAALTPTRFGVQAAVSLTW